MKVSISWLKELVDLNIPVEKLVNILPLKSISTKEVTDDFIELDMKGYNRADLLSVHGVAQEVAAITGSRVLFEEPEEAKFVLSKQKPVDDVPLYCVAKIEGLRVGSSNPEWVKKLEDSGMRAVNNITDITNLIMLEYGQPLHAFEALNAEDIHVDKAAGEEEFITLDNKKRLLEQGDLLIKNKSEIIGLAGIMGGKNSEVTEVTTSIMLEAAIFNPVRIRKTATRLGLSSEASKRFQHGLTKKRVLQALNAAVKMYESLGGKLTAINLVGNFEDQARKITLSKSKLENLVGVNFEDKQIENYLKRLGAKLIHLRGGWEVEIPYWRLDVNIEEDLIEEVARMYGYEKIPPHEVRGKQALQNEDPIFKKISDLRSKLVEIGLTEVQTYSFYSTQIIEALNLDKAGLVKISNPISSETEYLRQAIWPNLLEVVNRNLRKGFKDIAIFEIGKVFENKNGNPSESYRLAIALCNDTDNPIQELNQIKQDCNLHPGGVKLNQKFFHPTRQMESMGEVHLRVLNKLGIEKRVAILEIKI